KTTLPFSLVIEAERCSHSISSYGSIPARVKYRLIFSPFWLLGSPPETLNSVTCDIVVAIALTPFALGLSICGVNHAGYVLDFALVKLLKKFVKKNLIPSRFIFNIDLVPTKPGREMLFRRSCQLLHFFLVEENGASRLTD